ncbi:hypothetical protein HpBT176_14980 [Helicobacter pylori]
MDWGSIPHSSTILKSIIFIAYLRKVNADTFSQTEINPTIANEIFVFKPKDENIDIVRQ